MKTVDVVIPVHNSVHWLSWCLEELFRFDSISLRKVYVVNDRTELNEAGKLKEIIARHPRAELINNENTEGGFGITCNLGASKCTSDIILFLNTDCLLTEGVIDRLSKTFDIDQQIALVCPFSNNSPNLTYPMFPGFSYRDMAELFTRATDDSETDYVVEACTVVGNCLMVRRDFFEKVGGFSIEWGVGYGEETDLHMKALSMGLKGVVHTGCYVYHFGGGTFNYEMEIEAHRKKNYELFMSKWTNEYNELVSKCKNLNPIDIINSKLDKYQLEKKTIELDILFYLPGINQSIGGINAVVAICNELIRKGLKVSCALVGLNTQFQLTHYKESVLFNFIYHDSDESFLSDQTVLPKVVFSTIFCSAPVVAKFASDRNAIPVQFIQGYECFFENGIRYIEAKESYRSTSKIATTSNWLLEMVSRHMSDDQDIQQLPLVINTDLFFFGETRRTTDIILVFRSAPDKGQWLLAELLDRIASSGKSIAVLCSSEYSFLKAKYEKQVSFIDLPLDQYSLAKVLRQSKVYVDASLHEGYGLIPLEAALCGCNLVLSDSGGIRDFVHHHKGELIMHHLDTESMIAAINRSLDIYNESEPDKPSSMQIKAGDLWYSYLQQITKDCTLPEFSTKLKDTPVESQQILQLHQPEYPPAKVNIATDTEPHENLVKRGYKSFIFPYIPRRVHLALKVLLSGKF